MARQTRLRLRTSPPSADGVITLRGPELHHLRVRRIATGEPLLCFDDSGVEYEGRLRRLGDDVAEIEVAGAAQPRRESPLTLTLAQAVLKSDHLDMVVEKATELGVARVILFSCERAIAQPSPARIERLRRVAESAAKQSGRVRLLEVSGPLAFADVVAPGALLFHPGAERPLEASLGPCAELTAIVGPEGGLSPGEVERAVAAGCVAVGLGPRILRAETAGIVACALLQYLFGDLGRS